MPKRILHRSSTTILHAGLGIVLLAFCLVPMLALGALCTWDGEGSDALASTVENWSDDTAPTNGDDHVVLNATTNKNMTWDLDVDVASWTQDADYDGTVTFSTVYGATGFTNFTITGDCVISNGTWTHNKNGSTEANRLRVTIGGNLIIAPDGSIDAVGKGYAMRNGPGGSGVNIGASYGGYGLSCPNSCYGSISAPTDLGSGAYLGAGGGAVWLTVSGVVTNDGLIGADCGIPASNAGSGGSIYLTAGALAGTGTVSAIVKTGITYTKSGGGRIALIVTNAGADFSEFTGPIEVTGIGGGGAGTIYLEKDGDTPGKGELLVDNNGGSGYTGLEERQELTYEFGRIRFANAAKLRVLTGSTLIATNTDFIAEGDPASGGIWLYGATLQTPDAFAYSNFSIGIGTTNSVFSPATSLTIRTNAAFFVNQPHVMTSTVTVAAGGKITHSGNGSSAANKMNLTIDGNLTIQPGGSVDVVGKGYSTQSGPGAGTINKGASYGGFGASCLNSCYGSFLTPTNLGSGAYLGKGGGVVELTVSGIVSNEGSITANSDIPASNPGSGGSIYLTAGSLVGAGTISASASPCSNYHYSGGGRIALVVTKAGANFAQVTGAIEAFGIGGGGAGTIYMQTAAQATGQGTVLVNNNGVSGYTDVPPSSYYTAGEVDATRFVVTNGVTLRLTADFTVGDIILSSGATLDLNSLVLTVKAREHVLSPGSVINEGQILWDPEQVGVLIIVR